MKARCAAQKAGRFVDELRLDIDRRCWIGVRAEFVRGNAEQVKEIGVQEGKYAEFACFQSRVGNFVAAQRQTVDRLAPLGSVIVV